MALRLFAALAIPDEIADRLQALQRGVPGANWRPRENLHLTLRFAADVPEPVAEEWDAALAETALRTGPFDLALKGVATFGKEEPHTLFAAAEKSEPLAALAAACERPARRVGLPAETRKFSPHVTLAYLRNPDRDRLIAFERRHALFASPAWRVDRIGLYSSHLRRGAPSLYMLESEHPLG